MVILDGLKKLVAYSELDLKKVMKKVREKVEPHGISEIEIELSKERPLLEITAKFNNHFYSFEYDGYPGVNEIICSILLHTSNDSEDDEYYKSEYNATVDRYVKLSDYRDDSVGKYYTDDSWSFE